MNSGLRENGRVLPQIVATADNDQVLAGRRPIDPTTVMITEPDRVRRVPGRHRHDGTSKI
jgi:hypothetical protein